MTIEDVEAFLGALCERLGIPIPEDYRRFL